MRLSLPVLIAIISNIAATYGAAVAEPNLLQLTLEIAEKAENTIVEAKTETGPRKSLLDHLFGHFMDNDDPEVAAANVGKKEPLPLSDHFHAFTLQDAYQVPDKDDLRDINGSAVLYRGGEFGGIDTFAHLEYANCYNPEFFEKEAFDIAIVGAPFDAGTSYRPGTRFGPSGIRLGSRRLAPAYSVYRENFNPYKNWAKIVDCGDPPVTPLDNRIALDQIYRAERAIRKHSTTENNPNKHPKVFTLGGDHTITLPAIKAAYENYGKITVIHFDSHLDTWNPYYFGGNLTEYQSLNHGTYLHYAHEKGYIADNSIHAAIRGPYPGPKDVQHDIDCGFDRVLARDIDKIGAEGVIKRIKDRIGDDNSPVYISVDVDSMDPAFTPATGTIEIGGWSTRELLTVLDGLEGLNVIGGDVVEVSPPYDNAEITSVAAAEVGNSIISLMIIKDEEDAKKAEKEKNKNKKN